MIEFRLDKKSHVPFYRQIVDMILSAVSAGTLLPGERLPTIRDLAVRLEVNPNTIVKAYTQLQIHGVLDTQQGSGVFVRLEVETAVTREERQRALADLCRDFMGRAQLLGISLDDVIGFLKGLKEDSLGM